MAHAPSGPVVPLRFQPGDTLIIRDSSGHLTLWLVVQRKMAGWFLKPLEGGDPRTWTDYEINDHYADRRLMHRPCNIANISKAAAEAMERTWEAWKPEVRRAAERRLKYVLVAQDLMPAYCTKLEAYAEATERVHSEMAPTWAREDRDAAVAKDTVEGARPGRRGEHVPVDFDKISFVPAKPHPLTLRTWFARWSLNGRDLRLLIPRLDLRGNRIPRYLVVTAEGAWDTYRCMRAAVQEHYLDMPRRQKDYAFEQYKLLCAKHGVAEVASDRTFRVFLRKMLDARAEFEARNGSRAAYLKFGIFHRTRLPDRPLEEVEVDHCLIDLFVVHPVTGKTLGRPWLTAIMDRATKVILGMHLSFAPPSYATLMRAMAHAMWPKDLSGIPGLLHGWPFHGVWDMLFTDNGKEFHSASLLLSAALLDFSVIPLPAKHPWLKGAIEVLWKLMGIQVFSLQEGATLSRVPDQYDPVKRATKTLEEVRVLTIQWLVNKYHQTVHGTLGCTPTQRFFELANLYPVRSVRQFDDIIRLTGEVIKRKIGNVGIRIDGLLYVDVDPVTGAFGCKLAALRARHGGLEREWITRCDPFDSGELFLLDDEVGEWITLPCTEPSISRGVSRWANRQHLRIARQMVPKGVEVTVLDIQRAKAYAEQQAQAILEQQGSIGSTARAARYEGDPGYFTRMPMEAPAVPPTLLRLPAPDPVPTATLAPPPPDVAPAAVALPGPEPDASPEIDFAALARLEAEKWK